MAVRSLQLAVACLLQLAAVLAAPDSAAASMRGAAAPAPGRAEALAMAGMSAPSGGVALLGGGTSSNGLEGMALAPISGSYVDPSTSTTTDTGVSDSPNSALAADMLVTGPDMWPFGADKQRILASAVQATLLYDSFVTITKVVEGPPPNASAGGARSLLAAQSSAIATVQIDVGTSDIVQTFKGDLLYQTSPAHNTMLEAVQRGGLAATNLTVLKTEQIVPLMPSTTPHGELIGTLIAVAIIVGFFFVAMACLEGEKNRACRAVPRPDHTDYQQVNGGPKGTVLNPLAKLSKQDSSVELAGRPKTPKSPRVPLEEQGVLRLWNHDLQEKLDGERRLSGLATV